MSAAHAFCVFFSEGPLFRFDEKLPGFGMHANLYHCLPEASDVDKKKGRKLDPNEDLRNKGFKAEQQTWRVFWVVSDL